jgi:GT2 family glycosyltransferase
MAAVLTFNSADNLLDTLAGLVTQTVRPDAILVVDNASPQSVDKLLSDRFDSDGIALQVVREPQNSGPAGGWERALKVFGESSMDLAWLLDDDIFAPPSALEGLLVECGDLTAAFMVPRVRQPQGTVTSYPAWHGVLIGREVVRVGGLPRGELFWWAEDTEYLKFRLPGAGFPLRFSSTVIVEHRSVPRGVRDPAWKYYYEARNTVYLHLHLRKGRGPWPRSLVMITLRAIVRARERRCLRLKLIVLGIVDGIAGRLGRRVNPEDYR